MNFFTSENETCSDGEVFKKKTLVFVHTRSFADTLASIISESGVPCTTIHGGRRQPEREAALRDFRMGYTPVLVATPVAERGLDIVG